MKFVIPLIFGVIVGASGALWIVSRDVSLEVKDEPIIISASTSGNAGNANEVNELKRRILAKEDELARERTTIKSLQQQIADLKASMDAREQQVVEEEKAEEEQEAIRREEQIASRMNRRIDSELQDMTRGTSMTPAQIDAVRALLEKRNEGRLARIQAVRNGETPPETMSREEFEAELAKILSPQQIAELDQYEAEIENARTESIANSRFNYVAPRISNLTDQQKDDLYAAYYHSMNAARSDDGVSRQNIEVQLDAQMRSVLTSEQYNQWKELESGRFGRPGDGPGFR